MRPEKVAKIVANYLMTAYRLTVPDGEYKLSSEAHSTRVAESGRRYVLPSQSLELIKKATKHLVPFLDFYSREKCGDRLATFIVEEKDSDIQISAVHGNLQRRILDFLTRLDECGNWEVLYVVHGVDLAGGEFSVGPCKFCLMDNRTFALWGRRFSTGRYDPPDNAPLASQWVRDERALIGQTIAVLRLEASDNDHAFAKGLQKLEEILNVLRFGQLVVGIPEGSFPSIGFPAGGTRREHGIVIRVDRPAAGTTTGFGGSSGTKIDYCRKAPGWSAAEQLTQIDVKDRNEMQFRLSTALQWISTAVMSPSAPIRLVSIVIAMESLLIEKSESLGKRPKLANRAAALTESNEHQRLLKAEQLSAIYTLRSECVHAGVFEVEKAEIRTAIKILSEVINALYCQEPFSKMDTFDHVLRAIEGSGNRNSVDRNQWISENAYYRWLNSDKQERCDFGNWLDAEREFIFQNILRSRDLDTFGD